MAPTIKSVGKLIIYPSSNARFPGSYNDLIGTRPKASTGTTATHVPVFLQGLIDGGVDITFVDASFHFGVQYSGDQGDWATGVAHSAALTQAVYPTMHGSSDDLARQQRTQRWRQRRLLHRPARSRTWSLTGSPTSTDPSSSTNTNWPPAPSPASWHAYLDAIDAAVRSLG